MSDSSAVEVMTHSGSVTAHLAAWRNGDRAAFDALVPLIYEDLRSIARQQLSRLRPAQTLNTTALVNESYAKIRSAGEIDFSDRHHFFAIAACAMRQIIVDQARSLLADKRQGEKVRIDLEYLPETAEQHADQLLLVNQLLNKLEQINPELVRLVECRFYAGYTLEETAEILHMSLRTVNRRWKQANAWLRELVNA